MLSAKGGAMRDTDEPQPSFADAELQNQGITLDGTLQAVSDLVDKHGELVDRVRQDLVRGLKNPKTGREGLNAQQVLRSFVLKSIKNWDLRELRERITDGITLRLFTAFFARRVPKHDAFNRSFNRLTPTTLRAVNEIVVQAAVGLGVEDGKKLRVDTTVVETDVHFPTDSTLLWDCVRVITRTVHRLLGKLPAGTARFPNHTRQARRRMQEIQRMTLRQRRDQQVPKYRRLIKLTGRVVHSAREVIEQTKGASGTDANSTALIEALSKQLEHYMGLADRVLDQARRRVLQGEQVPNGEKVFSIFEPHTDLIMRGKAQKPVEFGHKVFLAESGIGLITDYRVLNGNPPDAQHVVSSLAQHKKAFGAAPELYAGDRGFYSRTNVEQCQDAGVVLECIPQRGGKKTVERAAHEKSRAFRKGQRFRAGVEGRISVLLRGRGMRRCPLEGVKRFEVFVGAAVLANNLMIIAERLLRRSARRRRRAA
jgi:IS5 family transposase